MSDLYKEIWKTALDEIHQDFKNQGKEQQFLLWYNLEYIEDTIDTITVGTPSEFMWKNCINKKIDEQICDKIKKITGQKKLNLIPKYLDISVSDSNFSNSTKEEESSIDNKFKESLKSQQKEEFSTQEKQYSKPVLNCLKPEFTFENFITNEGSSNHFAVSVAKTVAENPGIKNPILLYGGVGLGKTHLMQAIGNRFFQIHGNSKKIIYIQSEPFVTEFTNSLSNKTQSSFKNKYRKVDLLLLDDIQFLNGKPATQEELFYTFEALFAEKKQMIFASDRPLKEIENLTERLVSRLGSGMCLNLNIPSYETRKAILYKKMENLKFKLPDESVDFIAKSVETNVRDLQAALENVIGYQEFLGNVPISIEQTKNMIKNYYKEPTAGNISVENIKKVVAEDFNITLKELTGNKRTKQIALARHIAFYLIREMTELSLADTGYEFGGKDHSSVINGIKRIESLIQTEPVINQKIEYLKKTIKEYKN